jgi:hypothetical protein
MTLDIVLVFCILALTLASFVWEKVPVEVTAISAFAVIIALGLLPVNTALTVLSNPAPVTVGAMFMVSAGLEKCGAIEILTGYFRKLTNAGYVPFLFVMILSVAFVSAGQEDGCACLQVANTSILRVDFRRSLHLDGNEHQHPDQWYCRNLQSGTHGHV